MPSSSDRSTPPIQDLYSSDPGLGVHLSFFSRLPILSALASPDSLLFPQYISALPSSLGLLQFPGLECFHSTLTHPMPISGSMHLQVPTHAQALLLQLHLLLPFCDSLFVSSCLAQVLFRTTSSPLPRLWDPGKRAWVSSPYSLPGSKVVREDKARGRVPVHAAHTPLSAAGPGSE